MNNVAQLPARIHNGANEIIARNIRGELGFAGIDQTDLAQALGRNDMWLSRRLNGVTVFSVIEVQAIADYFGIEPGSLFTERTRPTRPASPAAESVGRTGLEPVTDGSWVAPVTPIRAGVA